MEKFLDVLKLFLEKHFIPAIASITIALLVTAYTPEKISLYIRLGKNLYIALIFLITFLAIEFVIWLAKKILWIIRKVQDNNWQEQREKEWKREQLEQLWTYVDQASLYDKELLMDFLKSDNAPIESKGFYMGNGLMNSKYVVSTEVPNNDELTVQDPCGVFGDKGANLKISEMAFSIHKRQYKLADDFYELLKYSYETYGRISHFATEEENNG